MSALTPIRLCDLPLGILEAVAPALEAAFPEPVFTSDELADEKGRLKLAASQGKREAALSVRVAITQKHRENSKPPEREELV